MRSRRVAFAAVLGTLVVGTYSFFNTTWTEVRYPDGPGESCREEAARRGFPLTSTETWSNSTSPPGVRCHMSICRPTPVEGDPGVESCDPRNDAQATFLMGATAGDWIWLSGASAVAGTLLGLLTVVLVNGLFTRLRRV